MPEGDTIFRTARTLHRALAEQAGFVPSPPGFQMRRVAEPTVPET